MEIAALKIKRWVLAGGDISLLYLSLFLTLVIRYPHQWPQQWDSHLAPFTLIYSLWITTFYITGLYDLGLARNNLYFFITLVQALAVNAGLTVIFFYFIPFFGITPKTNLFLNLTIFASIFVLWRQSYNYFIKTPALLNNILVIGQSPEMKELVKYIRNNPQIGYNIKKIVEPQGVKLFFDLIEIITREKIKTVVTTINPHKDLDLVRNLYQCLPLNIILADLPTFYEKVTGKIPVSAIEEVWFLENLMTKRKTFFEGGKRIADIIISLAGGVITLILMLPIALLIKLDSPGPVFYRQKRVGKDNRIFQLIKFRSMYALTPDGSAEKNGAQWSQKKDRRITRLGNFLRKTRLDELPQLWNVLKGEMALVGPRPERPEFAFSNELLSQIPFYQIRHIVKPGLAGWAQIKYPYGSSVEDTLQKLQYDLYYIKNRGFILDIAILLKTIKTVLGGGGR